MGGGYHHDPIAAHLIAHPVALFATRAELGGKAGGCLRF